MNKKLNIFLSIVLLATSMCSSAQTTKIDHKNYSILVSSCDKYESLWKPFFYSLENNWPEAFQNKDLNIFLISNTKSYKDPRIESINILNESSWSQNMLYALEKVKTKYIILFLDDYWVSEKVDNNRLLEAIQVMERNDAAFMQINNAINLKKMDFIDKKSGIAKMGKYQNYRANLQLAIWEVAALKQILKPGESAWDFELAGSIRSSGYPKEFLYVGVNHPVKFINASHQGHITPIAIEYAQTNFGITIDNFPVLGKYNKQLAIKYIKHRVDSVKNLIARNIGKSDNSYRYNFE